ncbi:MAG TPA: phosphoglycerate dehydrogenase [Acidimicrobiales bacterium]|nr:phosphoglycerate dehydrogenase [Acidimicrobiales bacterium]
MARVLVTEEIAAPGLERLRAAGHEVDVALGLSAEELVKVVPGAAALIIRSATQVTADVLAAASDLIVVGRAGIGLDNVDVEAATRRGVMVVNAPQSNILSAAEHTMALLLAQARNVPQAHSALVAGRWERSKWEGVELYGKVLGVVGLGRVGALVSQRAAAFGMQLVAYDPYISAERARQLGAELLSLDEVLARADFLTVHLPKTPETAGLIGADRLALVKPGVRIVNTARGGIVDEKALAAAVEAGVVAGAALDVFSTEPCTDSPLFDLPSVVVTPHLGASTREAQDKAGLTIAEMVELALAGDFVPFAVNIAAAEVPEAVRPWLPLAERLGRLWASLSGELPSVLEIEFSGELAGEDTRILALAVQKGLFSVSTDEPVTFVNVPQMTSERGLVVRSTTVPETTGYRSLVTVRGGDHSVAGTTFDDGAPRVVMVDGHDIELPFARWMLMVHNDDRIGMVAAVAGIVADAGLNIVDLKLGRSATGGTAMMALSFEQPVPDEAVGALAATPGILDAVALSDV